MTPPGSNPMSEWTLSIDFGTTYTCAVMSVDGQAEVVLVNGEQRMPSAVLSDPQGGILVGRLAELQAAAYPDRLERNPKRRLGDGIFLLGGEPVQVIKAVAEIFRTVADEARRARGGSLPSRLRLTHPARWAVDGVYIRTLAEAVNLARLPEASFISEPVAAARYFAGSDTPIGAQVAVYDLGGGTFDTSVLRKTPDGFELLGRPGGIGDLGGEDFDESVYQFLGAQLPDDAWQAIRAGGDADSRRVRMELRRQAREAKEALSVRPEWTFPAPAPLQATLRITRGDLEELIRDRIEETIDELQHTIDTAGTTAQALKGIYLAGGSSRIPLVQRAVSERFGAKVQMLDEPKTVVARGAALTDETDLANITTHTTTPTTHTTPTTPTGANGGTKDRRRRTVLLAVGGLIIAGIAALALLLSSTGGPKHAMSTPTVPALVEGRFSCGPRITVFQNNDTNTPYETVPGGATPPTFSTGGKAYCLYILATGHDNGGKGVVPGRVGLQRISSAVAGSASSFGPSQAQGLTLNGKFAAAGAPATIWYYKNSPTVVLDGTYRCIDSDPTTWSATPQTGKVGTCVVQGGLVTPYVSSSSTTASGG